MTDKKYTVGMILIAINKEDMFENQVAEVKTKSGSIFAPVLTFDAQLDATELKAACDSFTTGVNKIIQKEKTNDTLG